jgi:hypothetical protein
MSALHSIELGTRLDARWVHGNKLSRAIPEELTIIAAIFEWPVIEDVLTRVGLDQQPPPRGRAREAGQDQSHLTRAAVTNTSPPAATPNRCRSSAARRVSVAPSKSVCS